MAHKILTLGVFDSESAADAAAASLKDSGLAKHDAIGVLALDDDGKIKVDKVAPGAQRWARVSVPSSGCWDLLGSASVSWAGDCWAPFTTRVSAWTTTTKRALPRSSRPSTQP